MTPSVFRTNHEGFSLSWEVIREGSPTVVFINGWMGSRPNWAPLLEYLQLPCRVVTLDLIGHYPAQIPPDRDTFSVEDIVAVTAAALGDISPDEPVYLVGHSMGGLTSLSTAAEHPELVRALIAISAPVWGPPMELPGLLFRALKRGRRWPIVFSHWLTKRCMPINGFAVGNTAGDRLAYLHNKMLRASVEAGQPFYRLQATKNMAASLLMLGELDNRERMKRVEVPVLLFEGEHDHIKPFDQGPWLRDNLSEVKAIFDQKAGHFYHFERPEEFARELRTFFQLGH